MTRGDGLPGVRARGRASARRGRATRRGQDHGGDSPVSRRVRHRGRMPRPALSVLLPVLVSALLSTTGCVAVTGPAASGPDGPRPPRASVPASATAVAAPGAVELRAAPARADWGLLAEEESPPDPMGPPGAAEPAGAVGTPGRAVSVPAGVTATASPPASSTGSARRVPASARLAGGAPRRASGPERRKPRAPDGGGATGARPRASSGPPARDRAGPGRPGAGPPRTAPRPPRATRPTAPPRTAAPPRRVAPRPVDMAALCRDARGVTGPAITTLCRDAYGR